MKKGRIKELLTAIFSLLATIVVLITASVAWFSTSTSVGGNGIQVSVNSSTNLIISVDSYFNTSLHEISQESSSRTLLPCVHDSDVLGTKLKKLSDGVKVNKDTGLPIEEARYEDILEDENSKYYIDYVCYISADGVALTGADLTATIVIPGEGEDTIPYHQAASIDFYVDGEYKDTLNLGGLALSNDVSYDGTTKKVANLLSDVRIPSIHQEGPEPRYLTITMRCYYDGALLMDNGNTFISTARLSLEFFSFGIRFNATGEMEN